MMYNIMLLFASAVAGFHQIHVFQIIFHSPVNVFVFFTINLSSCYQGLFIHSLSFMYTHQTGVRMISLSYSRISLLDIANRLALDSPEDAEFIVAKVSSTIQICIFSNIFLYSTIEYCKKTSTTLSYSRPIPAQK